MVGADQLLAGELVEPLGEAFREPPAVGEDDRAAMAPDQLEDPRVDRRPDAGPQVAAGGRAAGLLLERQDLAHRRHVVDRDDDLEVERLARAGIDDRHLAARPGPAEEPGDRLERPLRGGQPDPLHGLGVGVGACPKCLEALEAEGQMRPALRAGDGVDLVDDDVLDAAQDLAGRAGQHQVERFGGRDQDVRRAAGDLAPVLGRRVAGPAGDRDVGHGLAEALRGQGDAGQRGAQVALDVVGQRLERRDVQDADGAGRLAGGRRARVRGEPVEGPEERGQGLAAPRRGVDERVLAAGDRLPAAGLGVGGRLEAGPEPVTDGWREGRERIGDRGDCGHRAAQCTARSRHFDQMFTIDCGRHRAIAHRRHGPKDP